MKKILVKLLLVLLVCALMMSIVGCTHTHQYAEEITKNPTCTEEGIKTFTCPCGDTYTEKIAKTAHTEQTLDAVQPDCDSTGLTEGKKCSVCGTIIVEQTTIDATGHTVVIDEAVAPTCTQTGLTEGSHCSVCNEVLVAQTVVDALGHDMDQGVETTPATCTTDGVKTFACQRNNCDHTTTEVIPALGHDEVNNDAQDPTCTEKGWNAYVTCTRCDYTTYQEIPALGHDLVDMPGKDATCLEAGYTAYKDCSRCDHIEGKVEIPATGHALTQVDAQAQTCTEKGWNAYEYCSNCDHTTYQELPALGHDLVDMLGKDATCTEAGYTAYKDCSRCDHIEGKVEIPATGHTEETVAGKAPTCTETGLTEGVKCSVCGETLTAQQTVDALGHTEVVDQAVAPTCIATGLTEGKHCSVCNETLVAQEIVAALGHTAGEAVVEKAVAPTCTTDGSHDEVVYCSVCNAEISRNTVVDAKLGHDEIAHDAKAPTCTEKGWNAYVTCTRCDYTTYQEIPATGHALTQVDAQAPTCTEKGWNAYEYCSNCEHTTYQELPALGHDLVDMPGKDATCTEAGYTAYKDCSRCDHIAGKTEIPATGHTEETIPAVAPTCTETGLTAGVKCSVCGETLTAQQTVDALGHTAGEVVVENNVAPDCENAGSYDNVTYCKVCEVELSRETITVDALGHTVVIDEAVAPTCATAGKTEGKHCSVCNKVLVAQEEVDALGHTAGEAVAEKAVAPTCTTDGSHDEVVYCSVCNAEISRNTVKDEKLGHTEITIAGKAATCTTAGLTDGKKCSVCGETTVAQEEIKALGHDERTLAAVAATCTNAGKTEGKYCYECSATLVAQTATPKIPHTYDNDSDLECNVCGTVRDCLHAETVVVLGKAATCTEAGLTDGKKCKICDDVIVAQEAIPATGHSEGKIPAVEPTCTQAGATEGKKCHVCGEVLVTPTVRPATGHTEKTLPAVAATCTKTGLTEGKQCTVCNEVTVAQETVGMIDHNYSQEWSKNGSQHWHACTACGDKVDLSNHAYTTEVEGSRVPATCETEGMYTLKCTCGATKDETIPKTGHSYNAVETAPTCTEAGYTTHTCANCSNSYKDSYTDALQHNYVGVVTTKPTCTEKGVKTYTCQNDESHTYTEEIASIGHDEIAHEAKAPTCTAIGWNAYVTCSRCDYTTYEEVAATGHDYDAVVTAPTCTNKGYTTYTCACGDTYVADEVDALGHTAGEVVVENNVAPDCENAGSYDNVTYCTVCGEELSRQTITVDALGHDEIAHDAQAPTCTEKGWNAYVNCSRCDYTTYQEVSALGHDLVDMPGKDATCLEAGYTAYKDCSRCDHIEGKTEIPATGHTEETIPAVAPTCTETGLTAGVKCSVCGETLTAQQTVDALGHTEVVDQAVAPTCTATGLTEGKHCSVCNEVIVAQQIVEAFGHSYDNDQDTTCNNDGCEHVRQVAPVLNAEVVEVVYDVFELANKDELVIDFANVASNVSGLQLTYSAKLGEEALTLDGSSYTFALGSYDYQVVETTFTVTITYTLNEQQGTLTYTYLLGLMDSTDCRMENGGFEDGLNGWTVVGNIGNVSSDTHYWIGDPESADGYAFGMDGAQMFSAYAPGAYEGAVGTLTSPTFTLAGSGWVTFKVGALRDGNYVYVDVIDADTGVILARYNNGLWAERTDGVKSGCTLVAYKADLSAFVGKEVFFRISDNADSGYGLFFADSFVTYYASEPDGFNNATPVGYAVTGTIYDVFNGGFEMGGNQGWWNIDEIGVVTNANGFWGENIPYGKDGEFLFTGAESFGADTMREGNVGTLTSSVFQVGGTGFISYMLGGGNDICYVQVIDSTTGEILVAFRQQARDNAVLKTYVADLSAFIGRSVRIQLVDNATSDWGCMSFDNVVTYYVTNEALPQGAITANNILANKTALKAELEMEVAEQGDYTADSFHAYRQKFDVAIELAGNVYASQTNVDNATNALREARLALAVRPVEEVANADKNVRLMSGNDTTITLTDYVNTNNLSDITFNVQSNNAVVTLSEIVDGKFTITAGDVAQTTNATVTITVSYKGEAKLTVELAVVVTNDVAPTLKQKEVVHNVDTVVAESVTIDFAQNVSNLGNLDLTFSAKHGETDLVLDGSIYTFVLGSYQDEISYETFAVTVSYTANGTPNTLEYTYTLKLVDTTKYRITNGGFEDGLTGWTKVGEIGNVSSNNYYWGTNEFGMDGDKMFSAYEPSDMFEKNVGTLTSSTFTVGGSGWVTFKIGAMRHENYVYIDVVDAETKEILARYYNGLWTEADLSGCKLVAYKADLSAFMGREVFFRISDNADSGYGLFFADSFNTYYEVEPTDGFNNATRVSYAVSGTIYDLFNGGFEMGNVQGWWSIGEIGLVTNANGYWGDNIPYEKVGDYLFTGVESNGADTMREGNKGTLTSSVFQVAGTGFISFKLGGGGNELCYVQVIDSTTGEVLARYHQQAQQDAKLIQYVADLSAYIGRTVRIQVVDYASGGWGCVSFDNVVTYYPEGKALPDGAITAENIFHGNYNVTNGSFENGLDGWSMNIWEAGAHNTLGWVESSEHDAGWYTKNDDRKDGNNLFTFCRPDGTNCENTKGELVSSVFTLKQNTYVSFRFGGAGSREVRIELVRADGTVIATFFNEAPGKVNTEMHAYYYEYTGETADCFFRVVDDSVSNYGCFVVDDFRANLETAPDGFIAAIQ